MSEYFNLRATTKGFNTAIKLVWINLCALNLLKTPRELLLTGSKRKTSEVYSIQKSAYASFFDYTNCDFCTIDGYQLSNVAEGETINMESGIVSATMGTQDISTSFNIVP
jgi:hypothetical protein